MPAPLMPLIDAHKLDNLKPYIFKTTDFGKSWSLLTNGLPETSYVHAVREDPKRKGYALCRNGNRHLGFFRRWRALADSATESADHADSRFDRA